MLEQKGFSSIYTVLQIIVIVGLISGAYYLGTLRNTSKAPELAVNPPISETTSLVASSAPVQDGVVTGKLCYPSEFIPQGRIEAKDLKTGKLFYSTVDGSRSSYSISLIPGRYHLRYSAHPSPDVTTYGYYDGCTGIEDVCHNQTERRSSIAVEVGEGETKKDVDLCDFYYPQTLEPSF